MKIFFTNISFSGQPQNYGIVDKYVSRSAQPQKDDFVWLKSEGVTDIFNFRTMRKNMLNFDEEEEVRKLGMNYHHIPSVTVNPDAENVEIFLEEIEKVKAKGGKAHIHCMAGADRTGMYAFIYKMINNIGTFTENLKEWYDFGLHYKRYSNLTDWAELFVKYKKRL